MTLRSLLGTFIAFRPWYVKPIIADVATGVNWARTSHLDEYGNANAAEDASCKPIWFQGKLNSAHCAQFMGAACVGYPPEEVSWPCNHSAYLVCEENEIRTAGGCEPGPPLQCSPQDGNPVEVFTGEKVETVTDFATEGVNPLAFVRTYRSNYHILFSDTDGVAGPQVQTVYSRFGRAWRSNFDTVIGFGLTTDPTSPSNHDLLNIVTHTGGKLYLDGAHLYRHGKLFT